VCRSPAFQKDPTDEWEHVYDLNANWLFVVKANDQAGGRHQLKMLKHSGESGSADVNMTHALSDTLGEQVFKAVLSAADIH
jgi:hypothetical protein